jgi:hypothetical protein
MPLYLDTIGNSNVAIGICGRCSMKFPLVELSPDPNSPGLLVCGTPGGMTGKGSWTGGHGCSDMYDPWRLPPRETECITLTMPRPDVPLILTLAQSNDLISTDAWTADSLIVTADSLYYTADATAVANIIP